MISILILTKNEELDLPQCLDSVSWSNDVHVFDSYSSDKTIDIANKKGAKVYQREFDGYSSQRNYALTNLNFANNWVLILDGDERIPQNMVKKLMEYVDNANEACGGFRLRRKDYLWNTWLKYSQITPFYIRLVRKGKAKYHREINEIIEIDGEIQDTDLFFNHYPFSKGITHWINKHNVYSSMEAERYIYEVKHNIHFSIPKALFSNDFNERRYHQKGLFFKLPLRPVFKFLYMFFWRFSFLDGYAGITYTILQSIYEYFIIIKTRDLLKQGELNSKEEVC